MKKLWISLFISIIIFLTPISSSIETEFFKNEDISYKYQNLFKIQLNNESINQIYQIVSEIDNIIMRNKALSIISQILNQNGELIVNKFFNIICDESIIDFYKKTDASDVLDDLYDFIFNLIVERLGWLNDFYDKTSDIIYDAKELWNDRTIPAEIKNELNNIIDKLNELEDLLTLLAEGKYFRFLREWSPFLIINDITSIVESITVISNDLGILFGDIRNFVYDVMDFITWFNSEPWKNEILIYGRVMENVFNGAENVTISCRDSTTQTDSNGNFSMYISPSPSDISLPPNEYYGIHKCVITAEKNGIIKESIDELSYVFSGGNIFWVFMIEDDDSNSYKSNIINSEDFILDYNVMFEPLKFEDINEYFNPIPYGLIDTPDEFNWKNLNGKDWTTPAKHQGNCGSCWDFAAIGTLESIIKIRENRSEINPDLSEQYVLSCLPMAANYYGQGCRGGTPYNAFYFMMDTSIQGNGYNGAIPENCFPYQADDDIPCSDKSENWIDCLIEISDCGESWLGFDSPEARDTIKSLIHQHGPIAAGINVTQDFINYWSFNQDENDYYPDTNESWGNRLNHIIVIVGWHDDSTINNGGYWICKNSWGTDWGYDGFFNIEYGGLFTGTYISWVDYEPNDQRPYKPSKPIGRIDGKTNTEYHYTSSGYDPNGDQIFFLFDWGDGTNSEWIGPYESGETVNISYSWSQRGSFEIKTKIKDIHDLESEWSDPLIVNMPKNKIIQNLFYEIINRISMIEFMINKFK
jgi:hypothetical protein